ncbi:MAG: SgcJ/EcaC family oxidoreductase [Bryobacteraceae bacterium]
MKLLLTLSILAGSLLAQSRSDDETAVREIVRKYVDARDQQDPRAIEALFTHDADQLVSSGEWRKGREEIVRGTIAASQNEAGKRTITVESVRFLAPGVALADGRYEIGERRMWTALLLTRDSSGWRIAAIRNMLPAK